MTKEENGNGSIVKSDNENKMINKVNFQLPESISDFGIEDLKLSTVFICQDQSNKARDKGIVPGSLYDSITLRIQNNWMYFYLFIYY